MWRIGNFFIFKPYFDNVPEFSRLYTFSMLLGGCPFNGPLSGTKYPTRAASPIKYNADQEPVKLKRLEP